MDCGNHRRYWLKSWNGAEGIPVEALWEEVVSMCLEKTPKLGQLVMPYMKMEKFVGLTFSSL